MDQTLLELNELRMVSFNPFNYQRFCSDTAQNGGDADKALDGTSRKHTENQRHHRLGPASWGSAR